MTTIIVNGKVQRVHASTVTRVQSMLEHCKDTNEIATQIRRSHQFTQVLVDVIKDHTQMGVAA